MAPRPKGKFTFEMGKIFPDSKETEILPMSGPIRDWQIKCVCGGTHLTCNGGWMKRIEDTVRPIITPMITGEAARTGSKVRLSTRDQALISTWSVLKTMVAAYDKGSKIRIHHMQRKFMFNKKAAPRHGWGVWIGHYEKKNWKPDHISHAALLLPAAPNRTSYRANYYNSGASSYVIGNLFIHVIHTPMPRFIERWRFPDPQRGTLFKIWPASGFSIMWPGATMTDRDADNIAGAVGEFILTIQRERLGLLPAS